MELCKRKKPSLIKVSNLTCSKLCKSWSVGIFGGTCMLPGHFMSLCINLGEQKVSAATMTWHVTTGLICVLCTPFILLGDEKCCLHTPRGLDSWEESYGGKTWEEQTVAELSRQLLAMCLLTCFLQDEFLKERPNCLIVWLNCIVTTQLSYSLINTIYSVYSMVQITVFQTRVPSLNSVLNPVVTLYRSPLCPLFFGPQ